MKRTVIWIICLVMGISFVVLLVLQSHYAADMVRMRQQQFDENVFLSLDDAARKLEQAETFSYLQEVLANHPELHDPDEDFYYEDEDSLGYGPDLDDAMASQAMAYPIPQGQMSATTIDDMQSQVEMAYAYGQEILDEVVCAVVYTASKKQLEERLRLAEMDNYIRIALEQHGITQTFHYIVYTAEGEELCRCPDFNPEGSEYSYTQMLFRSDPTGNKGSVRVHFPDRADYVMGAMDTFIPAMIFTLVLFVTFIVTVYLIVRQKRITEMKNDFVHNMTHEFKTPLSTISIAAQMLADNSLPKSPETYERLGDTINNESQRLRFQVEKVLQMSLIEKGGVALKSQELDVHDLVENIVETFSLKVTQNGGTINTRLEAINPFVDVDEMHFTNVIFNLLDNAVKYKRDDVPLRLEIRTWNQGKRLCISVSDNGIGINKEALKHIFDRFYRVHTGDKHNVKGFGLGLAYVHTMVQMHHGTIKVQSEPGKGTTFTISMKSNEVE